MEPIDIQMNKDSENNNTVLIIEDNPANLRLVTQLLEGMSNINILSAAEPFQGLKLAEQHKPDLILLDINLPGIDGYEVLKLLRKQDANRHIVVIAISANAMSRDIERGLAAGFDEYITKPIDVRALKLMLEHKLADSQ
jgi:CheY-like chemotaxis protein